MRYLFLLCIGALSATASLCLKQSRMDGAHFPVLLFLAGGFISAMNMLLYVKSMDYFPVSVAYLVQCSVSFTLLTFLSGRLMGERICVTQWLGAATILLGTMLMTWKR